MSTYYQESFYENQNFLNVAYAVDISLENHFSDLLFKGDNSRIVYSKNEFAMRKRARDSNDNVSTSNLDLPFMNYKTDEYRIEGDNPRWHIRAYSSGVYIPELDQKIIYAPLVMEYEATFWCNLDEELRYAFNEVHFDSGNKTTLTANIDVDGINLPLTVWLSYDNLQFDPEYDENEWLERNRIHSAAIDFQVQTFTIKSNKAITVTDEVLFNFVARHGIENDVTYEEAYKFLVDHVNEEVNEA